MADEVIAARRATTLEGRRTTVRREHEQTAGYFPPARVQ
jgi:hypothetical protein